MKHSNVSIIIPAYNGLEILKKTLPTIVGLDVCEIIVVDDFSQDETSEFIAKEFPQIKLIKNQRNLRFPKSVNIGFANTKGEFVVLLNQDVFADPDLLNNSLPFFENPKVSAVTFNEQDRSWSKAEFVNGFINYSNGSTELTSHNSFWASGGSAIFRKSHWDELGGFDPLYTPGYYEDVDFGYRAYKRGYQIVWSRLASVSHSPETTFSKSFSKKNLQYIKERNFLLLHWKNLDLKNLPIHLIALFDRILQHPGFIVPTIMALFRIPSIVSFRQVNKNSISDTEVFSYV